MAKNNQAINDHLIKISEKLGKLETLPKYVKSIDSRLSKTESKITELDLKLFSLDNSVRSISLSRLLFNFIIHIRQLFKGKV